ncbi:hypothetical protein [Deinococcus marmoris]|uniref:Mobile element protein n=1 Tax=Deinococcus marmoris TaxID=249408 RepID=A0A1U7P366_9DEIO|nr:hypothetical protein [Deinococcus marmoris]OLV19612.1 hypothetical protein BOO71_0002209 [Deinococcus marmoris]
MNLLGITHALEGNTALKFLGLASCGTSDSGLVTLMGASAGHPRLVSLDLCDAQYG